MIRTVICSMLLAFAAAQPACAQDWARKMFPTTSHDFGSVARGAKTEFLFKFSNIYKEDIHVASVRSSCSCTTPSIVKDTLKTYEDGAILAHFNTHSFTGHKSATVTVVIDKPFYAEVQLHVQGTIRSDIVVTPGAVELGSIDAGQGAEKRVTVTYAGRSDWKIVSAKTSSSFLTATVGETNRRGGQVSYDVTVALKSDAPLGYVKEQVVLMTNDPRSPEVPVDVEARVVAELTASPSSLFFGAIEPGQKVNKQIVVQGKRPFRVTNVTSDDGTFEFKPSDAAKAVHLVPVIFTADDKPGKFNYKIRIETDLGGDLTQEISAVVQVVAPTTKP